MATHRPTDGRFFRRSNVGRQRTVLQMPGRSRSLVSGYRWTDPQARLGTIEEHLKIIISDGQGPQEGFKAVQFRDQAGQRQFKRRQNTRGPTVLRGVLPCTASWGQRQVQAQPTRRVAARRAAGQARTMPGCWEKGAACRWIDPAHCLVAASPDHLHLAPQTLAAIPAEPGQARPRQYTTLDRTRTWRRQTASRSAQPR